MTNWLKIEQQSRQRHSQRSGNGATEGGIFQGLIDTSSGENQNARVQYANGERNISLVHPFESTNSWIRSIPETGQTVLLAYRNDTGDVSFLRYLNEEPKKKLELFDSNLGLYRRLLPGEHEIHSSGLAQAFFSSRPSLELRGGVIKSWLDQDKAECGQKAPLHTRQLIEHDSTTIGDEERLGIVRRPAKLNPANAALLAAKGYTGGLASANFYEYPYPDFSLPGGVPAAFSLAAQAIATATQAAGALIGQFKKRPYGKEYIRVIKNGLSPIPPDILIDVREGQVFEDPPLNNQAVGPAGAYLRARYKYFTPLTDATTIQIDEIGNIFWDLSLGVTKGWVVNIPGLGGINFSSGLAGNTFSTLGSATYKSLLSTTIDSKTTIDMSSTLNTSLTAGLNLSMEASGKLSGSGKLGVAFETPLNMDLSADSMFTVKAGVSAKIDSPLVAVGNTSPLEPAVLGTELTTWLQNLVNAFVNNATFMATGNLGAPAPANPAIITALSQLLGQIPTLISKSVTVAS